MLLILCQLIFYIKEIKLLRLDYNKQLFFIYHCLSSPNHYKYLFKNPFFNVHRLKIINITILNYLHIRTSLLYLKILDFFELLTILYHWVNHLETFYMNFHWIFQVTLGKYINYHMLVHCMNKLLYFLYPFYFFLN